MLKSLAKFVVKCADLLEAEGRLLRRQTYRLCMAMCITSVAVLAVTAALVLIGVALYCAFQPAIGTVGSMLVVAVYAFIIGGIAAWVGVTLSR